MQSSDLLKKDYYLTNDEKLIKIITGKIARIWWKITRKTRCLSSFALYFVDSLPFLGVPHTKKICIQNIYEIYDTYFRRKAA